MTVYEKASLILGLINLAANVLIGYRQYRLERLRFQSEQERELSANLAVQLVKYLRPGRRTPSYRLQLINHGPAVAYNVTVAFQTDPKCEGPPPTVDGWDHDFPLPELPPNSPYEIVLAPSSDTAYSFTVQVTWDTPDKRRHTRRFPMRV